MNERIKQLAEKANIEFTYDPTETPMRAFAECWADELEKFAELIVAECANVADDNYIHRGSRTCGLAIRLHFGVEE
jgi:hypothetical protein